MIGEYLRFTADELSRALNDPEWARERADVLLGFDSEESEESEDDELTRDPSRAMDIHKTWHLLSYLLSKAGAPIDVALGGTVFAAEDDWGYGPPRYLTPAEVREAAAYLRQTPYPLLGGHFDAEDMTAKGIYPAPWEGSEAGWAQPWYLELAAFFGAAADAGDAIVLFLD